MIIRILAFIGAVLSGLLGVIGIEPARCETRPLFADGGFENGFTVLSMETENGHAVELGRFTYSEQAAAPSWKIAQWNSKTCLWSDRTPSDAFTITDGKTKTVSYNPSDKSVSMRLNAANVYGGEAAPAGNWPHLLLEQSPLGGFSEAPEEEKAFYNCGVDKMILSLDIRLADFKDTANPAGINAAQFLAYLYVKGVENDDFVWFGVNLFDSRGLQDTYWNVDTAGSNRMIYTVSTADTYGCGIRSLYRFGKPFVSNRWTHVKVNITPHLERMIKKANETMLFGRTVSAKDFYIGGTNIGFEIHGNYDCTVDIKNYRLTSRRKIY